MLITNKLSKIIKIIINLENLEKIPLQILFYYKQGFRNFILEYKFENIKIPLSKIFPSLQINLLKIIRKYQINIYYSGIPKCIFETLILKPQLRFEFENYLKLIESKFNNQNNISKINTSDIDEKYLNKFGSSEFIKLIYNQDLFKINKEKINTFNNNKIKKLSNIILEDFNKEKEYKRKRILFVNSFPEDLNESSKERIIYYIFNSKKDFENIYLLLSKYFDNEKINVIKDYLKKANDFAISLALMGDNQIRKSLYFTTELLNSNEILNLSKKLNVNINTENSWGIGIDNKNDSLSFKTYYIKKYQNNNKIIILFNEFKIEKQKKLLYFLKEHKYKIFKSILIDYKYKNNKLFSKKIEFSFQHDSLEINKILKLLDLDSNYLINKELYTICFEISNLQEEKVNLYYQMIEK